MKNNNIDTAVILAAGKGERISNTAKFVAKPLIKIFDLSLIERSIKNLINNLNVKKRPISAVADNYEVRNAKKVRIQINRKIIFNLLYDKNNSLQKKIKIEQLRKEIKSE